MDERAVGLIKRFESLASARGVWESHWREIDEKVRGRPTGFNSTPTPGSKATDKMFDATPALALDRFASAVESLICPRNERWHGLEADDPEIAEDPAVKRWCEALCDLMFRERYRPRANFASQASECFNQLGSIGTTGMFSDGTPDSPLRYRSQPIETLYVDENHQGVIDTVYRKFELNAVNLLRKFPEGNVPEKVREAAQKGDSRKWSIIHCVYPNDEFSPYRSGARGFPVASHYVLRDTQSVIESGGYRRMPYAVSRNVTNPREVYGRSPAMIVLADIKMLHEMSKTVIRHAHRAVAPPLLIAGQGAGPPLDLRPDGANYGMVDESGRPMVQALQSNARIDIGEDMLEQRRRVIQDAFLVTLFQILVENRQMTAYEAALRAQEKGQLLAPTMGRQESEFLGPIIERDLDLLWDAGIIQSALPPMPRKLEQAGGVLRVVYTSPLARLQRAEKGVGILRTFEQVAPIAQVDSSILDNFDMDECARTLADVNGMPEKAKRDPASVARIRAERMQRQQIEQAAQIAPAVAGAAKDLVDAQATAASSPIPPMPAAA